MAVSSGLLMSQRRYVWTLFPIFFVLARWGERPWFDRAFTAFSLLGLGLIAVGVLDALVGLFVVLPRTPETTRPVLRATMLGASTLLILLGGLILTGLLDP